MKFAEKKYLNPENPTKSVENKNFKAKKTNKLNLSFALRSSEWLLSTAVPIVKAVRGAGGGGRRFLSVFINFCLPTAFGKDNSQLIFEKALDQKEWLPPWVPPEKRNL